MNINELIKKSIYDKNLRDRLLSDPVCVCKSHGITTNRNEFDWSDIKFSQNFAIIQGGYRP